MAYNYKYINTDNYKCNKTSIPIVTIKTSKNKKSDKMSKAGWML